MSLMTIPTIGKQWEFRPQHKWGRGETEGRGEQVFFSIRVADSFERWWLSRVDDFFPPYVSSTCLCGICHLKTRWYNFKRFGSHQFSYELRTWFDMTSPCTPTILVKPAPWWMITLWDLSTKTSPRSLGPWACKCQEVASIAMVGGFAWFVWRRICF